VAPANPVDAPPDPSAKPFLDHLEDLRWTLIKILGTWGIASVLAFVFRKELFAVLMAPLWNVAGRDEKLLSGLGIADSFTISLKVALYGGAALSLPFALYFAAQFLLPALTPAEKKLVLPVFLLGVFLFLGGLLSCYFYLLPVTLRFFIQDFAYLGIKPQWTLDNYVSFVTQFAIGMGASCEFPVVLLILARMGIVTHEFLKQKRRYVIVAIFVLAACVTPTSDFITMTIVALPLLALYEICVWVAWAFERRRNPGRTL